MSIFSYFRKHAVISIVVGLAAICIAIIAGRAASQKTPAANDSAIKQVTLVNASTFRKGNLTVSANGIVESHSQADLKSQTSAPVSIINVAIGETVYPGEVIMELQNADIRAQLMQAEASLQLAQGQYSTGAVSLDSAKRSALDKLRDAYNKTYDAVTTQADPILYNTNGGGGQLVSLSPDTKLNSEITSTDLDLRTGLRAWKDANDALDGATSTEAIEAVIKIGQLNMSDADLLLNDMSKLLNALSTSATPSFLATLTGWSAIVSGAQSSVSGAEQALTAAEMALNTANSSQGTTAPAQVSAAQAGVNNLKAQLAKTVISSPITGKISNLPLREGELASPGMLLATVIGSDTGLEIKAYVSGDDLSRVEVGAPVVIQSQTQSIKGIISNVAPGVDSITKKAEVDVDVLNPETSGLVIGNTVTVAISPLNQPAQTPASTDSNTVRSNTYILPIQDVKIVPGAAYVFTVDADSKIKRNDVTLGQIQGDFIEITSGITDDMNIVTPVYELDPGQQVKVQ